MAGQGARMPTLGHGFSATLAESECEVRSAIALIGQYQCPVGGALYRTAKYAARTQIDPRKPKTSTSPNGILAATCCRCFLGFPVQVLFDRSDLDNLVADVFPRSFRGLLLRLAKRKEASRVARRLQPRRTRQSPGKTSSKRQGRAQRAGS